MTYVPAYRRPDDIVRRPFPIKAVDQSLAVSLASDWLRQNELDWRLVQVTDAETGESVFREGA